MPTLAETRLAAYLAAEAAILQAQEVGQDGSRHRLAELADVRAQIDKLQQQVAREQADAAGAGSFGFSLADFSGAGR